MSVASSSVHHVDPIIISELEETMQKLPKLSNVSAGIDSCCIFRAPPSLSKINEEAYRPRIVSIGPFHHGEPQCQMIQEHKGRFLLDLLLRAESKGALLKDFLEAVAPMEEEIRKSYSETLEINSRNLIEMIVLDGCFIIELFCKFMSCKLADAEKVAGAEKFADPEMSKFVDDCKSGSIGSADRDNPLITMDWVLPSLMRDLLRLENQIPYFVLQKLFGLSVGSGNNDPFLAKLALWFFNYITRRPRHVLRSHYRNEGKHLLDLFRKSYIPSRQEVERSPNRLLPLIQCARKLDQAGVKFRPTNAHSILDIKFRNGLLEIPILTINDFSSSLFLNFVAYEQCYRHSTQHITTYATFMGHLMSTPADAGFLSDHKIIENYFGTDEEVARFFNNVGKEVAIDIDRCYLSKVFEEANELFLCLMGNEATEYETADAYVYEMDMPSLTADRVRVEIRRGRALWVIGRGDKTVKVDLRGSEKMKVREAKASLRAADGVLTVEIPKRRGPRKWHDYRDSVFMRFKTVRVPVSAPR